MKTSKRIAVLLLIAVMLFSAMPASATGEAAFEVQTVSAKSGESVDVTVSVKNSPGITSTKLVVTFDDALTLTNVTYGTDIDGQFVKPQNMTSPIILNWTNGLEDFSGDYVFATLTFQVAANAEAGLCPITVSYDPDDVYNIEETNESFVPRNGGVNITCSHSFDEVSAHAATCDNDGNNALYICNLCNKIFKADGVTETTMKAERIPALGHDMAAATCTAPATCKREDCGYTDGEALGHNYKAEWEKNANGHWHICGVCNEPSEVVPHVPGAEATENSAQICTVCGFEIAPPIPHIHATSKVEGFAATCTQAGQKTYYTCSCGKWFEDEAATVEIADHTSVAIAALGHDMATATCTEAAKCRREGCDYTEGEALGHNLVDATCLAPKHCDRCDWTDGEALPHTEGAWQLDSNDHWKNCASCETELEATRQPHTDADADGICEICENAIPVTPATGDMAKPWLLGAVMLAATAGAVTLLAGKKRVFGK